MENNGLRENLERASEVLLVKDCLITIFFCKLALNRTPDPNRSTGPYRSRCMSREFSLKHTCT